MKKQLLTIIFLFTFITVFTGSIHRSYAQSNAPVHTGQALQEKLGGLFSQKIFVAPIGFFKKSFFLPGNNSSLKIGSQDIAGGTQNFNDGTSGAIAQNINTALFNDNHTEPIVIDLYGRSGQGIAFLQTDNQCSVATRLVAHDVNAFEFKNNTERAHIIARQVQLTGNDPQPNKVLVSDSVGNTRWASASVVNGQVVFSSGTSVVESCIIPPPDPIDVCSNIAGIQPTEPKGYIANIDGTCTQIVDLCLNIDEIQTTLPDGYEILTPGECTPIDVCTNLPGEQVTIPSGYESLTLGICTPIPTPVCSNPNANNIGSPLPCTYDVACPIPPTGVAGSACTSVNACGQYPGFITTCEWTPPQALTSCIATAAGLANNPSIQTMCDLIGGTQAGCGQLSGTCSWEPNPQLSVRFPGVCTIEHTDNTCNVNEVYPFNEFNLSGRVTYGALIGDTGTDYDPYTGIISGAGNPSISGGYCPASRLDNPPDFFMEIEMGEISIDDLENLQWEIKMDAYQFYPDWPNSYFTSFNWVPYNHSDANEISNFSPLDQYGELNYSTSTSNPRPTFGIEILRPAGLTGGGNPPYNPWSYEYHDVSVRATGTYNGVTRSDTIRFRLPGQFSRCPRIYNTP
jgi:hypothetical protein